MKLSPKRENNYSIVKRVTNEVTFLYLKHTFNRLQYDL